MFIQKSLLIILWVCLIQFAVAAQDSRAILFNLGWKFHKGDVKGGNIPAFDDTAWRSISLPHDWSIEGPFSNEWASGTGYLPGGIGWYRKTFKLDPEFKGKRIYLYFDGVYKNSEVWINGKFLGKRPNGYASFYYDISDWLKAGDNVIAVKADHTDFADSRWYPGSGINRNVYLIPVAPLHIAPWQITFTTPIVTEESATVRVQVAIKNITGRKLRANLKCEVLTRLGKVVGEAGREITVNPKGTVTDLHFEVLKPELWSPESPALYTLRTSIIQNGFVTDVMEEQVGFRTFSFDAQRGLTLNGKSIKMKGVCFHDDAGTFGSAVPARVWERRLQILKDMGCNAIRMSHNPHQDYLYDLCDRMGFLVQDEAFDEWEAGKNKWIAGWNVGKPGNDGYSKDFKEWAAADLRDMILRNRNRTCIIMWSIGNEIDYPNDPYTHEILNTGRNPQIYGKGFQPGNPPAKRLGELARQLAEVVRQTDKTRPVTAALAGVVMSNTTEYPGVLDLVGYNYQEYRYGEDHATYPNRIIYGSENSKSFEAWRAVEENEFISGQFLWTAFDFLGEARAWPVRSSGAGLIDMAGFPKPEFYQRQAWWSETPVLYVSAAPVERDESGRRAWQRYEPHWNWSGTDSVEVRCYSSMDEVELILNGRSVGRQKISDDKSATWRIPFEKGKLVARGFIGGKAAHESLLTTTGKATNLVATTDKAVITTDRDELAHIEINIEDACGQLVANATDEITVTIQGPAKLLGLESGSLDSHESYQSNTRKAVGGKVMAFVQAEGKGQIKIIVSGSNLISHEVHLLSE